jgi:nicotinamide-nucleotide amidase
MPTDEVLLELAEHVGRRLLAARRRVVAAESCTGGWIAKALTDVPGSSQWFECGYVVYSNAAKMRDLGVSERTLQEHGAVSEATVRELAAGALRVSGAHVAVSVSGVAGPDGATAEKPVGMVWFGLGVSGAQGLELVSKLERFPGNRATVRRRSVECALRLILGCSLGENSGTVPGA